MNNIKDINIIKEFTNDLVTYGVYSLNFKDKQEIFIRNGDSVATISFLFGSPASKCINTIRDDIRQEFFKALKSYKQLNNK